MGRVPGRCRRFRRRVLRAWTSAKAAAIDPQHRLLLETSWEAIEHAGMAPSSLAGSLTGVYRGVCRTTTTLADQPGAGAYGYTGTAVSMASGRVAYALNLHGPALTVDTACSSGLLAVHMACRSLRRRGKRPRPGRRLHSDPAARDHGVGFGAGHAVADRAVPGVRRGGRRIRPLRGLRGCATQAAAGCVARR